MTTPRPPEVDLVESTIDPLVFGLSLVVLGAENESHPLVIAARIALEQLDALQYRRDMKAASNAISAAKDWRKYAEQCVGYQIPASRRDDPVPFRVRTCIHQHRGNAGPNWDINGPCDACRAPLERMATPPLMGAAQ